MVFFDLMLGNLPICQKEVDFPWSYLARWLELVLKLFSLMAPVEKGHNGG